MNQTIFRSEIGWKEKGIFPVWEANCYSLPKKKGVRGSCEYMLCYTCHQWCPYLHRGWPPRNNLHCNILNKTKKTNPLVWFTFCTTTGSYCNIARSELCECSRIDWLYTPLLKLHKPIEQRLTRNTKYQE